MISKDNNKKRSEMMVLFVSLYLFIEQLNHSIFDISFQIRIRVRVRAIVFYLYCGCSFLLYLYI